MENEQADAGRGWPNPSRETKFSGGMNGDREIFIFPGQLTTSRIGNLTRSVHTLASVYVMTIHILLDLCDFIEGSMA